jgi:hypothetical protein
VGTCTLDFDDPATGNANYSAALQVTQSFPVGGLTATQVGLALGTTTPAASATTNVTITMTLENAVGAAVNSSGTTTVVLSDIGGGFFSTSNAAAGTPSLDVSFKNGTSTATAYFGDESAGPDAISVISGTTIWSAATLTIQGGAATQVAVTPNTSSPTVDSVTNTALTLQLADQWGNTTKSSGTTTLALSNSGGGGFFSSSIGAAGTSTLNVTFAAGVGTVTVYFGSQVAGPDIVAVKNGASTWATSTMTMVAGAATQAQITLSSTSPPPSGSTNTTVTVQLQDQYGNSVHTSGVSFTLTNSGAGFFNTTSGTSGSPTLVITTNASGVAKGYFGDNTAQSDTVTATGPGIAATTAPFTV